MAYTSLSDVLKPKLHSPDPRRLSHPRTPSAGPHIAPFDLATEHPFHCSPETHCPHPTRPPAHAPHPQAPHIASFDFVHATCFIARLQARQQHAHRAAYSAAAAAAAAAAEAADPDPRVVAKVSATMCQAAIKYKMEDFINSVAGPPQGSRGGGSAAARASVPRGSAAAGGGGGMVVPPPRSAGGGGSGAGGGTASTTTSGLMEVRLRNHLKRIGKGSLRQYGLSVGLGWTLLELVNADVAVRVDQVGVGSWEGGARGVLGGPWAGGRGLG